MIALYKGKSWLSRAIQWQTRSPYSHAAWLLKDGSVIEAWQHGGVAHNSSLSSVHTPGTTVDIYFVGGLADDLSEAWLRGQIGTAYDWHSVFRFLSRRNEDAADRAKWFCSELVYCALLAGGVKALANTEPWEVSPGLLARSPLLEYIGTMTTQTESLPQ